MINEINSNQLQGPSKNPLQDNPNSAKTLSAGNNDALYLEVDYASLIDSASRTEDKQAVERARQLLLSGELENAENIRQAAENIITTGI